MVKTVREFFEGSRRNKWARALSMFLAFALLCALVVNPGLPSKAGGLTVGNVYVEFAKPALGSLDKVQVDGTVFYRISTAQYPVVVVKQSNFAIIWKYEDWDAAEIDDVYEAIVDADSSIGNVDNDKLEWVSGEYANTVIDGPRGYYYYEDGYFYVDAGKLSHIDYGEDVNYASEHTGTLTINKVIDPATDAGWTVGDSTIYQARVELSDGSFMTVTGTAPNYNYSGKSPNGTVINFSQGTPSTIRLIPDGVYCVVLENGTGVLYNADISPANVTVTKQNDYTVTVTNTYEPYASGGLVIYKDLIIDQDYVDVWDEEFGVNEDKWFEARVRDLSGNNYLVFEKDDTPGTNVYTCVGNTATITPSQMAAEGYTERVSFRKNEPATVDNLWAFDSRYRVEEIGTENCTVAYTYDPGDEEAVIDGDNVYVDVTVTNTYGDPTELTNDLIIKKRHDGRYYDWLGSEAAQTVYTATVKNRNGNTLRFTDEGEGVYQYKGTSQSNGTVSVISFTVSDPAFLKGLPGPTASSTASNWPRYTVTETRGANYSISYEGGNEQNFPAQGDLTVTVVNTYVAGNTSNDVLGSLIVHKTLEGYSQPPTSPFTAKVYMADAGGYMKFDLVEPADPNNPYVYDFDGNDSEGAVLTFTEDHPATINGIPNGVVCKVVETPGARYNPKYSADSVTITRGNNHITVNNVYRHSNNSDGPNGGVEPGEPEGDDEDDDGDDDDGGGKTDDPVTPVTPEVTEEDDDGDDDGDDDNGGGLEQGGQEQPDPTVPGGPNRGAPPVATDPANRVTPQVDENNNVYYVEIDDVGTALGEWHYSDEDGEWIFDPYPPPLANMEYLEDMPQTGDDTSKTFLFALAGLTLMLFLLSTERRKRGAEE